MWFIGCVNYWWGPYQVRTNSYFFSLSGFKNNANLPQLAWTIRECSIFVPNLWPWGTATSFLQVIFTILLFDYHMTITWLSCDHHMTITWPPHNHHMTITWPSHDHHMTITWPSCGWIPTWSYSCMPTLTAGFVQCLVVSTASEDTYSLLWFPGQQTESLELSVLLDRKYHARKWG